VAKVTFYRCPWANFTIQKHQSYTKIQRRTAAAPTPNPTQQRAATSRTITPSPPPFLRRSSRPAPAPSLLGKRSVPRYPAWVLPPPPPPRQLPQRVEADGSCSRPRSLSPSPPPPLCDSFRSAWSLTGDAAGPDRSHHPRLARVSTRAEEAKVRASCLRPSYPCLDPSPRAARARPASGQWRLHCSPVPPLPPYYLAPGSSNSGVETSVWVGISELGVTRIGSEGACWVLGCLSSGPLSW
jgi:hypothetical protein